MLHVILSFLSYINSSIFPSRSLTINIPDKLLLNVFYVRGDSKIKFLGLQGPPFFSSPFLSSFINLERWWIAMEDLVIGGRLRFGKAWLPLLKLRRQTKRRYFNGGQTNRHTNKLCFIGEWTDGQTNRQKTDLQKTNRRTDTLCKF